MLNLDKCFSPNCSSLLHGYGLKHKCYKLLRAEEHLSDREINVTLVSKARRQKIVIEFDSRK